MCLQRQEIVSVASKINWRKQKIFHIRGVCTWGGYMCQQGVKRSQQRGIGAQTSGASYPMSDVLAVAVRNRPAYFGDDPSRFVFGIH